MIEKEETYIWIKEKETSNSITYRLEPVVLKYVLEETDD